MFGIPQPGIEPDGSSDERPLILEGIEKRDFIQLLRCLYLYSQRAAGYGFSLDQWNSVLKLSNLYGMIEVKNIAVENMTSLLEAESPSLQIHLAQVHDIPKWLEPAKNRQVERSNPIDENDMRLIGPTFALEVCALREMMLREMASRERRLLEKALEEKASLVLEKVLLEKTLQEKEKTSFSFNFEDAALPQTQPGQKPPEKTGFNFSFKDATLPQTQPGQKPPEQECKNQ